jgi:hypothetical protein
MPGFGPKFRRWASALAGPDPRGRLPHRVPPRRPVRPGSHAVRLGSMCWYGGERRCQNSGFGLPSRPFCQNGPGFALAAKGLLEALESYPGVGRPSSAPGASGAISTASAGCRRELGRRSRKAEASGGRLLLSWLPGRWTATHRHLPLPGGARQVPYAPRRSDPARGRPPEVVLALDRVPGARSAPVRHR